MHCQCIDASIIFMSAPYIMYEQFNFEGKLISEHVLRRGSKQTTFFSLNLTSVYKSDQCRSIYDTYNTELASTKNQ